MPSIIVPASSVGQDAESQLLASTHVRESVDRRKHVHSKLVIEQIVLFVSQWQELVEKEVSFDDDISFLALRDFKIGDDLCA